MDERIEVNRAGIGLAIAGAVLMVVAVFLPRVESQEFFQVVDNTLVESGDGWLFIGLAVVAAAATYRTMQQERETWSVLIIGVIAIGVAIYNGTGERLELVSAAPGGLGSNVTEKASPGIGIYAAGAGGALVAYGGILLAGWGIWPGGAQAPARRTKRCPDCAETILADARVCKHCGHQFETQQAGDAWRCDLCGARFDTRQAADKHAERDHADITMVEAKRALRRVERDPQLG